MIVHRNYLLNTIFQLFEANQFKKIHINFPSSLNKLPTKDYLE